jgi:hypothetical protein
VGAKKYPERSRLKNMNESCSLGAELPLGYNEGTNRRGTMAIRYVTRAGVGLVIGIIVLGLIVFGILYFVRERGDQARQQEAINIANEQLKSQSDQGVALNQDNNSSSNSSSQNSNSTNQSGSSSSQSNSATMPQTSTAPGELPKTGPEATPIVAVGLLTFAVASFMRSRKLLFKQF